MPDSITPTAEASDADALLRASAAWAGDLAEAVCPVSGAQPCADFHVPWQELRLLGLAAGPERHEAFFSRTFDSLAAAGQRRVLIAGAADYGMLACVHRGFGKRALSPVVADLCATPLMLCAWYGAARGLAVSTVQADLTHVTPDAPWVEDGFDVITSHSVLRYFASEARAAVLARWRALLRPGGALVTVTRLVPEAASPAVDSGHVERFVERALQAAEALDGVPMDRGRLARRAARFARAGGFHPTRSITEVADVFEAAGFRIERLDDTRIDGALGSGDAAPGSARRARYAEIVAVRP